MSTENGVNMEREDFEDSDDALLEIHDNDSITEATESLIKEINYELAMTVYRVKFRLAARWFALGVLAAMLGLISFAVGNDRNDVMAQLAGTAMVLIAAATLLYTCYLGKKYPLPQR